MRGVPQLALWFPSCRFTPNVVGKRWTGARADIGNSWGGLLCGHTAKRPASTQAGGRIEGTYS